MNVLWSIFNVDPIICRTDEKPRIPGCEEGNTYIKCDGLVAFKYGSGWIIYARGKARELLKNVRCVQLPYIDITGVSLLIGVGFIVSLLLDWLMERKSSTAV